MHRSIYRSSRLVRILLASWCLLVLTWTLIGAVASATWVASKVAGWLP